MKGSIRLTLLVLGMIAMVACVFDSGDTKTDRDYEFVWLQDYTVSPVLNAVEYGFALCPSGDKGVLVYNDLSFEVEEFYIRDHESKDLFEITIGDLAATQFG